MSATFRDSDDPGPFTEAAAWSALQRGLDEVRQLPEETRASVKSITVAGSLVRGDFLENRSDVDLYTIYNVSDEELKQSEIHQPVRACFDRQFIPYKGRSHNPFVWDDIAISIQDLPHTRDDFRTHNLKTFGIYYFDFVKHHQTLWGEDFTKDLPPAPDPKTLVPARLGSLVGKMESIIAKGADAIRLPMFAVEAVRALQIYFSEEPSNHKAQVSERYRSLVPEFEGKAFGLVVWGDYVRSRESAVPLRPLEDYCQFLRQTQKLVEPHSS